MYSAYEKLVGEMLLGAESDWEFRFLAYLEGIIKVCLFHCKNVKSNFLSKLWKK